MILAFEWQVTCASAVSRLTLEGARADEAVVAARQHGRYPSERIEILREGGGKLGARKVVNEAEMKEGDGSQQCPFAIRPHVAMLPAQPLRLGACGCS